MLMLALGVALGIVIMLAFPSVLRHKSPRVNPAAPFTLMKVTPEYGRYVVKATCNTCRSTQVWGDVNATVNLKCAQCGMTCTLEAMWDAKRKALATTPKAVV